MLFYLALKFCFFAVASSQSSSWSLFHLLKMLPVSSHFSSVVYNFPTVFFISRFRYLSSLFRYLPSFSLVHLCASGDVKKWPAGEWSRLCLIIVRDRCVLRSHAVRNALLMVRHSFARLPELSPICHRRARLNEGRAAPRGVLRVLRPPSSRLQSKFQASS